MKDFLGNDLAVGDEVVMLDTGKYKGLSKAIVESFAPKMVRLTVVNNGTKANRTINQYSHYLIKIVNNEVRSPS